MILLPFLLGLAAGPFAGAVTAPPRPEEPRAPATEYVQLPIYEREPVQDDYRRTFPRAAFRDGVRLEGTLDCRITHEGRLADCRLLNESTPGYGFEAAALEVLKEVRLAPKDRHRRPVAGRRLLYSMHYDPPAIGSPSDPTFVQASACLGRVLAQAEAAGYTDDSRAQVKRWTVAFTQMALRAGLDPAGANARLDQARKAAKPAGPGDDARCAELLKAGLG